MVPINPREERLTRTNKGFMPNSQKEYSAFYYTGRVALLTGLKLIKKNKRQSITPKKTHHA